MDLGYKGFTPGILIEAMTSALGGYGRKDNPERWGASVFVQVIDPGKFAGEIAFLAEMENFRNQCLASGENVRMPGANGLKNKEMLLKNGILLSDEIVKLFFA